MIRFVQALRSLMKMIKKFGDNKGGQLRYLKDNHKNPSGWLVD